MPRFSKHFLRTRLPVMTLAGSLLAMALVAFGIWTASADYRHMGGRSVVDFLLWSSACIALATTLKISKVQAKEAVLTGFVLLYLAAGIGFGQTAATLYFAFSSFCLGRLLLYAGFVRTRARLLLLESIVVGAGTHLALFGLLMHFPLNYDLVYMLILGLPLLLACLAGLPKLYLPRVSLAWRCMQDRCGTTSYSLLVLAVIIVGQVARFAFFPTISYDDNATHLRIWTLLSTQHVYDFDVRAQIWLVAPFAVDLLHAVISMIARTDARAAMNLGLLSLLLYGMWKLSSLINRRANERLLLIILFASTPLLASLLTGLQTELMLAVLATTGTWLVLKRDGGLISARGAALLMVAALCAATKLPGAVLGMVLLAGLLLERYLQREQSLPALQGKQWLAWTTILILAGFVAFHSYGVAWKVTGNPLFPLYNGYFKSPFFGPYNFTDTRYVTGLSWRSYWDLFFNTGRHYESHNFVAGFQYVALFPLALAILLIVAPARSAVRILLPLFGFGIVMFAAVQYLRYLFPVLPLASVLIGALFYGSSRKAAHGWCRHWIGATILLFTCVNMYFSTGINWYLDRPVGGFYSEEAREAIVKEIMPEQIFNAYLNREAPGAGVLYEDSRPFGATLMASPTYVNWYAPATQAQTGAVRSEADMQAFLQQHKISYVMWDLVQPIDENNVYRRLLRMHLDRFGEPLLLKGGVILYRLQGTALEYRQAIGIHDFHAYANTARKVTAAGELLAESTPAVIETFDTGLAGSARYSVSLTCPDKRGSLIAQINWNSGPVYYRLITCNQDTLDINESIPVPVGASHGELILTSRDTASLKVRAVAVGLR